MLEFEMFDPVKFVSLGPGDPELITLKGWRALKEADKVFCPSTTLFNGVSSSRAKDILLQLGIDAAKIEPFDVPMNKDRSLAITQYREVASLIAEQYSLNNKIAVTAEGDAGFYSTIYYICEFLQKEGIPTLRIAGVPAFIACGALANIHVVKQEEELLVIPGIVTLESLTGAIRKGRTVVVMKASYGQVIIKESMAKLPDAIFHYFENAGIPGREFYTSDRGEIDRRHFPYFSLLIIQS